MAVTKNTASNSSKEKEFADFVISVRRVTKVTKGGKRFSFSALVISGNQQGQLGVGLGKSREVSSAIAKGTMRARKNLISVPLRGTTIPYNVEGKHGACKVILRSAYTGTGIIAGGSVRSTMEALGIKDILAKSFGASNPMNTLKATLNALAKLRSLSMTAQLRGKTTQEIIKGSHVNA